MRVTPSSAGVRAGAGLPDLRPLSTPWPVNGLPLSFAMTLLGPRAVHGEQSDYPRTLCVSGPRRITPTRDIGDPRADFGRPGILGTPTPYITCIRDPVRIADV
ncbi:hypothetical protein GCM10010342_06610 [Streptomyces anulatus]|nr:hypothetical protein GCM10010342_06610 [Streptomyces anulatus]